MKRYLGNFSRGWGPRANPLPSPSSTIWKRLNLIKQSVLTPTLVLSCLSSIGLSQQRGQSAQLPVSRITQIALEDQAENPGNTTEEQMIQHGIVRRAETRKLLAEGKIVTSEEFSEAALIFQHGQTSDDYLLGHVLAVEALTKNPSADKWLAAATLDRYLQSINKPQVFGTQFTGIKAADNAPKPLVDQRVLNIQRTQQPYTTTVLSDAIREGFCVPNLSQQVKNLEILNTGHRPERNSMRAPSCAR